MRAKQGASGTGSAKRTRWMRKPGSAAPPAEYWNTPGTNRNPPAATAIVEDIPARLPGTHGARVRPPAPESRFGTRNPPPAPAVAVRERCAEGTHGRRPPRFLGGAAARGGPARGGGGRAAGGRPARAGAVLRLRPAAPALPPPAPLLDR